MNLLRKICCIILVLNLAACGGGSSSKSDDNDSGVTPPPTTVTPPPVTVTPPTITPIYHGKTNYADLDIDSVKPAILDMVYALDIANVLIFGAEKRNQLLRPENDFTNLDFSDDADCNSGSQSIDFREFAEKIKNREKIDIDGEIFKVSYNQCAIGNFVLNGTAELFVKGFDNENFEITSFNLNIDKTLELNIDDDSYQLQGTVYSLNEKDFTLDIVLIAAEEHQNIYLNELSVQDPSNSSNLDERLRYNGNIYFSQAGKLTITAKNNEQLYTFLGENEHKVVFDFSKLNSRFSDNLGFVNLELNTSYYNYPKSSYYFLGLEKEHFLIGSNMRAFQEPNIFQFIFPRGTRLEVEPKDPPIISGFIKQEWQLVDAPEGVDKSIHYGPAATFQLSHYGEYTLKNVTTDTLGTEKIFFKSFSVPKVNNINANIEVETLNWQLGTVFKANVVSDLELDFTASLAFGPSGMTVTEGGEINWDGNFFDFGNDSKVHFGVFIETASGKSMVKHSLLVESKVDKQQFKLANSAIRSYLYPENINKHRSEFLYKKDNTLGYTHSIGSKGFSRLEVSEDNIELDYVTYNGASSALTLFDISYNEDKDLVDYLLLQNTFYLGELAEDRLKIETDLPWVLFNSNTLNNYVEVFGDENSQSSDVINRIDAQFVESKNSNNSSVVYSNSNLAVTALKLTDKDFVMQSQLQSNELTRVINHCKRNENEQILISYDQYVHVKNDDITLYNLRSSDSGNIGESKVFALDTDNNSYCDSLLFISTLSNDGQNISLIEAFHLTETGPLKVDSLETSKRLYSFNQLNTIYDIADSSQNIVMFDRNNGSNANALSEPVNAFIFSLSADDEIVQKPLVYGSALDIVLSSNKSHIINILDTNDDGIDEVIITHHLSTNEKLIESFPEVYTLNNRYLQVHVIAKLNNGILEPQFISKLLVPKDRHISLAENDDIVIGNGLQPVVVTPIKEIKIPAGAEQFMGSNIFINSDNSRYQISGTNLEKYSSNNQLIWTTSSIETEGGNRYVSIEALGKYKNIVLIRYGSNNKLYFINDTTGELIFRPNTIRELSISPDFNQTGLLFFNVVPVAGAIGAIQGSGIYRVHDEAGVELVHNWDFSSQYKIRNTNVSWINADDDNDFELLIWLDKRDGNNEVLIADYNGENQVVYPFTKHMDVGQDLSRSAAWDIKREGYFSYGTYRSKLTGEVIWQFPVNSFYSDTRYKNGVKQFIISDNGLYLFEAQ